MISSTQHSAPSTSAAFRFDFGRIKLKDRPHFAADMQRAFHPPAHTSPADADRLLIKWMAKTVVAWPDDGNQWDDPTMYADISITAFMEGVRAFGAQFHTAFNRHTPTRTAGGEKHLHRAHNGGQRRSDRA